MRLINKTGLLAVALTTLLILASCSDSNTSTGVTAGRDAAQEILPDDASGVHDGDATVDDPTGLPETDTGGGRDGDGQGSDTNSNKFRDGSCEGPGKFTDDLNTGCGWIYPNEEGLKFYIQPDANLSYAHLIRANLSYAHLIRADLRYANLWYANLRYANLWYADLRDAILYGANLSGAILSFANLTGANLSGANLNSANLIDAILYGANLSGADLRYVNLKYTDLRGADLSGADLSDCTQRLSWCDQTYGAQADSSTTCPNGKPWGIGGGGNCPF